MANKKNNENILQKELFRGKSVEFLFKDIYDSINEEDKLIKKTIESMLNTLKNADDVDYDSLMGFVAPTIKEFIDVSIKNKEQLIKLAAIAQKYFSMDTESGSYDTLLTEEEREKILGKIGKESNNIQEEIDQTNKRINKIILKETSNE